jgi:signal transduction histidine kinase/CheY-like chemotaxis protein
VQFGIALHNLALYADTRLLADQLRMRSEEIAQKNSQLEAGSRMKSEFLASMSHELRTPLNAIIGFSEVLKDGLAGELSPEQNDYIGDIFSSGQHLLSLINDVLDLSKVEAGKMELEPEPVDVRAMLANSLAIVREPAFARHIRLTLEMDLQEQTIQADERKLKQIVYNLLSNAVKFSADDGEVTVSARCVTRADIDSRSSAHAGRTITLPPGEHPAFLEIRVTDKGIGIPPDALDRLFEPFTQVDAGLARRFEGTGLGLALVHRLAELHGGTVRVESVEHHGSSFFVWIPWQPAEDTASTALPTAPALQPSPIAAEARWVLVIEDDDAAARLIRRQLESEGLNVLRVASAEVALDAAGEHPFALITLDIMLPGMDGWEFLNRVKEIPALARVPVVIISIVADGNKGISLGAAAILQKPFSREQLHRALANLGFDTSEARPLLTLVADDDPKAVEIIAASLPEPGFRVLRAYGGREAIEVARRHTPDLIVLDLMMPEVNGFDVVEALKSDPRTAQIPVLVVTAKHIEAEDRARLNGHVIDIVGKSEFNHGRFVNEVRRALITRKDETWNAANIGD